MSIRYENRRHAIADQVMAAYQWLLTVNSPKAGDPMKPPTVRRAPMTNEFGCAGLCSGDGCVECARLADQITHAKQAPRGPHRDARLLILADRVAGVMGARREVTR